MLYAYFGGLGADKLSTYELVLEQRGYAYELTSILAPRTIGQPQPSRWGWLRQPFGAPATRRLFIGTDLRRALLTLLDAACEANRAALGQRYCYVLPSVPTQGGALAVLVPPQLRHDSTLPIHPQLWQAGRPLDTLPAERHDEIYAEALHRGGPAVKDGSRAARR